MTIPDNKREMLPCPNPWCRHQPTDMPVFWKREGWRVYCDVCNVSGPRRETEALAITAWNARCPDPRVGELERALAECAGGFDDLMSLAQNRLEDGDEMGASIWRLALTDIKVEAAENARAARRALSPSEGGE